MGIREAINEKRSISIGATIGIIVLAIGFGGWYLFASDHEPVQVVKRAYFTVDDGATFFVDEASKMAPFVHDGKQAFACTVFTTDGGKTKFAGWLTRYSDDAKRRTELNKENAKIGMMMPTMDLTEVRKPGTKEWYSSTDPRGIELQKPPTKNGVVAQEVLPE